MPEIGRENGITYSIHLEAIGNQKHSLPHVHARYQDYEASIDFEGNVFRGEIKPDKKEKEARQWVKDHITLCKRKWEEFCIEVN